MQFFLYNIIINVLLITTHYHVGYVQYTGLGLYVLLCGPNKDQTCIQCKSTLPTTPKRLNSIPITNHISTGTYCQKSRINRNPLCTPHVRAAFDSDRPFTWPGVHVYT